MKIQIFEGTLQNKNCAHRFMTGRVLASSSAFSKRFLEIAIKKHRQGLPVLGGTKESLSLDILCSGKAEILKKKALTQERVELIEHISSVIEKELFYWKQFEIHFPNSQLIDEYEQNTKFDKFFEIPKSIESELKELALDENKINKKLNPEQLSQVRETGKFKVESKLFPGKYYEWELTSLLSKGNETHRTYLNLGKSYLYENLSKISSHFNQDPELSLKKAFLECKKTPEKFISLLFGSPEYYYENFRDFDYWMNQRRLEYIYREFNIQSFVDDLAKDKIKNLKFGVFNSSSCEFINELDLRIYNSKLWYKVTEIVNQIYFDVEEQRIKEKVQIIKNLCEGKENFTKEDEINILFHYNEIYFQKLLHEIKKSEQLKQLGNELPEYVISFIYMDKILKESDENQQKIQNQIKKEIKEKLIEKQEKLLHLNHYLNELIEIEYKKQIQCENDAQVINYLKINKLKDSIDILEKLSVSCSNDLILYKKLKEKIYIMKRDLHWHVNEQENSKNWINLHLKIPFSTSFIHKIYPQSKQSVEFYVNDKNETCYYLKQIEHKTVLKNCYFWRFKNLIEKTKSFLSYGNSYCFYMIKDGFLSYKSLTYSNPFYTTKICDSKTGVVSYIHKYETLMSRIYNLKTYLIESRKKFENSPDVGFISKKITRIFNILWCYSNFIIGVSFISIFQPLLVLSSILLHSLLLPLNYIVSPLLSILSYCFDVLIYDFSSAYNNHCKHIRYFPLISETLYAFASTIGRGFISLLCSLLIRPFIGIGSYLCFSFISFWGYFYDFIMFHLFIKRRGRIPSSNSISARCIHGPGILSNFLYKIETNEVLAAIQIYLENLELSYFSCKLKSEFSLPNVLLVDFYNDVINIFNFINHIPNLPSNLHFTNSLEKALNDRKEQYPSFIVPNKAKDLIRLEAKDLRKISIILPNFIKNFVEDRIFLSIFDNDQQLIELFWNEYEIVQDDWDGLANYFLTQLFGKFINEPFRDDDCFLHLEINHQATVGNFIKNIELSTPKDDLDEFNVLYEIPESSLKKLMNRPSIKKDFNRLCKYSDRFISFPDKMEPAGFGILKKQ